MLWLLEHVRLRVDPLKDAAGSPFGKADRLYLYLHDKMLSGGQLLLWAQCYKYSNYKTNWGWGQWVELL